MMECIFLCIYDQVKLVKLITQYTKDTRKAHAEKSPTGILLGNSYSEVQNCSRTAKKTTETSLSSNATQMD